MVSSIEGNTAAMRYRIDFALTVLAGNLSRYLLLRPQVEADPTTVARWYPVRTWFPDDPLRILPGGIRVRGRQFLDTWPLYVRRPADAVVIHAFETYPIYVLLTQLLRRKTVIINNCDDSAFFEHQNGERNQLRCLIAQRTDLFIPFSHWAARRIRNAYPDVGDERIQVIHPGIDLLRWRMREDKAAGESFVLLFVGGDFLRKGGETLLTAFESGLYEHCELHIVTQSGYLSDEYKQRVRRIPHVYLHLDLTPNTDELRTLYGTSDAFVLPTNGDASSHVSLEAMATGIPVITTSVGGIPEIVVDGKTGLLIPPKDPGALVASVERLRTDEALRKRLVTQGRAHVEMHFDGQRNTQRLLSAIKSLVDNRTN